MKIAIQLASQVYRAVEASAVTVAGINAWVHKSPSIHKSGICWAVTDGTTGVAFARSASKQGAINLAFERITAAGTDKVRAKLAELPAAPPAEDLEVWSPVVRDPAAKADVPRIVDLVAKVVGGLNDTERAAVASALSSRTGQLKAKAPSDDWGKAAWNGLQPNPYKIQWSACFLRGGPAELNKKLMAVRWPAAFDKDKLALVNAGVW